MKTKTTEQVRDYFSCLRATAEAGLGHYAEALAGHPVSAARRAGDMIEYAARLDVAANYLRWIGNGPDCDEPATPATIEKALRDELVRGARYVERCTDPCVNVFERAKLAAVAEALEVCS